MKISHLLFLLLGIALGVSISAVLRKPLDRSGFDSAGKTPTILLEGKSEELEAASFRAEPTEAKSWQERMASEGPVASDEEIDAYLEKYAYSKDALIAVARLTSDEEYLREAAKRYPGDPQVQLMVISARLFPDEQSEWIRRFKESQPDNALASLFYAGDLLAQGKQEEALSQFHEAGTQSAFNEYYNEGMILMDDAMLEFGYGSAEAKLRSVLNSPSSHLHGAMDILKELKGVAESTEDADERASIAMLGIAIGNQMSQGEASGLLINRVVGLGMEGSFLKLLNAGSVYPGLVDTPDVLLEELSAEKSRIMDALQFSDRISDFSEDQMSHYLDRVRMRGELDALEWARSKLGDG